MTDDCECGLLRWLAWTHTARYCYRHTGRKAGKRIDVLHRIGTGYWYGV